MKSLAKQSFRPPHNRRSHAWEGLTASGKTSPVAREGVFANFRWDDCDKSLRNSRCAGDL